MSAGIGEVEIQLYNRTMTEKETVVLKPTLHALKLISRLQGGCMGASQRIMQLELDTFVTVIRNGAGFTEIGAEKIEDRVYKTGLAVLAEPCVRYLTILANGGQPPKIEGEDSDPLEKA